MFVGQRLLRLYLEAVEKYCGRWGVSEDNVTYSNSGGVEVKKFEGLSYRSIVTDKKLHGFQLTYSRRRRRGNGE